MSNPAAEDFALDWLRPEADACWTWDVSCEVIIWVDGATLLFREELAQIIERLLPGKVPASAGLLLLLLAAAKGKIPARSELDPTLHPALDRLATLAQLPPELLSGIAAKAQLIEYFTPGLPCLPAPQARAVLDVLRDGLPRLHAGLNESDEPLLAIYLHQLDRPLRDIDIEALRLRLATGLDAPPVPAELESIAARVAQLLHELTPDAEFPGLVQMVRDIMAAITLPHPLVSPDVSALGGLSDISNRGPLHRLLTSELAHDHEVLTMRLAMNEALYLRSEPPASTPLSELAILIDSGIRLWGTPRVFATAAALALLAKSPRRQLAQTWRALPSGVAPVDLTRRPGLTHHLAALELNEHPGASLQHLAALFPPGHSVDLAVITHARVLTDPAFRLPALPDRTHLYLITVDREGHIAMHLATPQGLRLLKEATLDLSRLLPGKAPQVLEPRGQFPAIYAQDPFPFLLVPPELIPDLSFTTAEYSAGLSRTGTVWYWNSPKTGARQLPAAPVPGTPILFAHDDTTHCLVLLKHIGDELRLLRWSQELFAATDLTVIKDVPGQPHSIFRRHGLLYILYTREADIVDLTSGQVLARTESPTGLEKIGEGFFRRHDHGVGSLAWNGQSLAWEPIKKDPRIAHFGRVLQIFHRQGMEGPWLIDAHGHIQQSCAPFRQFKIALDAGAVPRISPDGHELTVPRAKGGTAVISIKNDSPSSALAGSQPRVVAPKWSIRTNFTHIACEAAGHILLRSRKAYWIRLQLSDRRDAFVFAPVRGGPPVPVIAAFNPTSAPPGTDLHLTEAAWPGSGSRAFLDRRGLLHLQSGNPQIPEVSIVLAESSSLPAWSSAGHLVGPAFFVGDRGRPDDATAIDGIIRSFIEAL